MAAAVAYGYANIFVTSPSPENLRTVFDFLFKGLDALEFQVGTPRTLTRTVSSQAAGCRLQCTQSLPRCPSDSPL